MHQRASSDKRIDLLKSALRLAAWTIIDCEGKEGMGYESEVGAASSDRDAGEMTEGGRGEEAAGGETG